MALAAVVLASLLSAAGVGPAAADSNRGSVGDDVSYSDGSPAADVQVDVYEASNRWNRGLYRGTAYTDGNGKYSFDVSTGCYITVTIAPLGSSFWSVDSGVVYRQQYGCVQDGPNNDFDAVLYRKDTNPTTTTQPPKTTTTVKPTTTTTEPTTTTTEPSTTTTTKPTTTTTKPHPPTDPPLACAYQGKDGRLLINGTDAFSFLLYNDPTGPAFAVVDKDPDRRGFWEVAPDRDHPYNRLFWNPTPEIMDPDLGIFSNTHLYVAAQDDDSKKKPSKRIKCFRRASPIGLDVDGSGSVERVNADVEFDFAGNGEVVTASEWFAPTEGILFDTRIEGPVTGAHLFGDQDGLYADGFEKLALLDANTDGQVAGAELDGLAIWTDVNTNGVLDAGEQSSLASHGVVSLSTSHTNMVSTAALADGSTMVTEDLWFPAAGVGAGRSAVQVFGLAGLGLAVLGYAGVAARRRRDGLDAELRAMTAADSTVS